MSKVDYGRDILAINDFAELNTDTDDGGYRGLNLNSNPFYFGYKELFDFDSCGFLKRVYSK